MSPRLPLVPALAAAGLVLVTLSACGRRGPLEDPGAAAAAAGAPAAGGAVVATPVGTAPARRRTDEAVRPNRPFILDPLL